MEECSWKFLLLSLGLQNIFLRDLHESKHWVSPNLIQDERDKKKNPNQNQNQTESIKYVL